MSGKSKGKRKRNASPVQLVQRALGTIRGKQTKKTSHQQTHDSGKQYFYIKFTTTFMVPQIMTVSHRNSPPAPLPVA